MAGKLNLIIERNVPFRKRLRYLSKNKRPINLSGFTARLQAKLTADSPDILFELTTENGGISLESTGYITFNLTLAQVRALQAFTSCGYDLIITPPGSIPFRLLDGKITSVTGFTQLP